MRESRASNGGASDSTGQAGSPGQLLERLVAWADTRPDVRGVVVIGSRARVDDHPADPWSDFDVLLTTTHPGHYLTTRNWLEALGRPWLTYVEPTAAGGQNERRVVFEDAVEADFAIAADRHLKLAAYVLSAIRRAPIARRILPDRISDQLATLSDVLSRGARILVDKDGTMRRVLRLVSAHGRHAAMPTEIEFLTVVERFWHGAIWSAKHIRRGELWRVKTLAEGPRHAMLLRMLEWHARAHHGPNYDTWGRGRFLEDWGDARAVVALRDVFARYDAEDSWRALFASMRLFRWLAEETAERLCCRYPTGIDEKVTAWVEECSRTPSGR
jgi:aminoglycoside 6-adenylyltransferase